MATEAVGGETPTLFLRKATGLVRGWSVRDSMIYACLATHARRLPTHLSISKEQAVAHHKHVVVIGGRLTSHNVPLRGKVVYLDRRTAHAKWVVVGKEVTHKRGAVAFVVCPKVSARYALSFKGSLNFRTSHSKVVTVQAKA